MGRKRRKTNKPPQGAHNHDGESLARCLAVQPKGDLVAISGDECLRVLNCRSNKIQPFNPSGKEAAPGGIQCLAFSPCGRYLLSGGDDKQLRIWRTSDWTCQRTLVAPKKVTAGLFTPDSQFVVFADKYGDVLVAPTEAPEGGEGADPVLLLGHLSSIVSSLQVSPDGRSLVSTDKEGKVRVSLLPKDPMQGSYEVQSYCMGHEAFVTSCSWVGPEALLVSGGGDGTVRLWNYTTGECLDTYVAAVAPTPSGDQRGADGAFPGPNETPGTMGLEDPSLRSARAASGGGEPGKKEEEEELEVAEEEEEEEEGQEEDEGISGGEGPGSRSWWEDPYEGCPAVLSVSGAPGSPVLALVVEGSSEVTFLEVEGQQLKLKEKVTLLGVEGPCRCVWDPQGRLWVVGGPLIPGSEEVHLAVIGQPEVDKGRFQVLTDCVLREPTREQLEHRKHEVADVGPPGTSTPPGSDGPLPCGPSPYTSHLRKRVYTEEERTFRERNKSRRTDYRENERLALVRGEEKGS